MCLFQERETKKYEPKEKYQKKQDLDKEEKGRKEPKALKSEWIVTFVIYVGLWDKESSSLWRQTLF